MKKWEVSNCCLDFVFNFCSLTLYANDKKGAMREYICGLINYLQNLTDADIERITEESDDCIGDPIIA